MNTIKAPMWDQMQVFCKHISDHQIRFVLHFNQKLNEPLLKDAVKITLENTPIIGAQYNESKKGALWKLSKINLDNIYSFQINKKTESLIQEAILKPLDTFEGPQLKISLIRSESDTLVLNFDHSITDASGVKDFACELAGVYSSLAQNKSIPRHTDVSMRSLKLIANKLSLGEKLSVLKLSVTGKRGAPTFELKTKLSDINFPGYITHTIHPVEFEKIKTFGKQHAATINDMILALYYYTLKRISNNANKTNRLTYSADLRVFLKKGEYETLSNFSAIHSIDIDNSISDFVDLLKKISGITKIRKQKKYNLADFPMIAMLFKSFSYKKLKRLFHKEFDKIKKNVSNASPGITNIGIIEESNVTFNTEVPEKAYMLGTINHPNLLIVAVSTYKKHLTLSIGSYFNKTNNNFISNFMEELKKTIKEEVVQSPVANSQNKQVGVGGLFKVCTFNKIFISLTGLWLGNPNQLILANRQVI